MIKKIGAAAITATILAGTVTPTFAAQTEYPSGTQGITTPSVTFKKDDGGGTIIDPTDPTNPILPIDPTNPAEGEFLLTYVSNFTFGEVTKDTTSVNAEAVKVTTENAEEGAEPELRAPFTAIKDMRGEREGWVLTATASELTSAKGFTLTGAEITLKNLEANAIGESNKPTVPTDVVTLTPATAVEIASATIENGIGNSVVSFGKLDGDRTTGVTLNIPASVAKDTAEYTGSIDWNLTADPTGGTEE